jgi:hypothetical protein
MLQHTSQDRNETQHLPEAHPSFMQISAVSSHFNYLSSSLQQGLMFSHHPSLIHQLFPMYDDGVEDRHTFHAKHY